MTAPSMADCLRRHGVPRDHWPQVSAAVVEFLTAHAEDVRQETQQRLEESRDGHLDNMPTEEEQRALDYGEPPW